MASSVLYLAWQDPQSRRWFTVGRLRKLTNGLYEFVYVEGYQSARETAGMEPLLGFMEAHQRYLSAQLFPLFQNRIMSPRREDYEAYIRRLGFDEMPKEPLDILARSEGHRTTDSLQVFPAPTLTHSNDRTICSFDFFIHGMRYVRPDAQNVVLEKGTQLFLMWDFQNSHDPSALTLRTKECHLLGWIPRFYCTDILSLRALGQMIDVTVMRTNHEPVPSWLRVMCRLTAHCPEGFRPLTGPEFRPLAPHAEL